MRISKYHALGNDYIVINPADVGGELTTSQIRLICHRNYGVGSDGLLIGPLETSECDFALRIFNPDGSEAYADLELTRIAIPRRVYTVSQIEYVVNRLNWLYKNKELVKGMKWVSEPPVLRFFLGAQDVLDNWSQKLCDAFIKDFGPEM